MTYRGTFGDPRPPGLGNFPPNTMRPRKGLNPLKAWRYVGIFGGPNLLLAAANVRVGPFRTSFYALWDGTQLIQGRRAYLKPGRVLIADTRLQIDITLDETNGIEVITGDTWTHKQGGIAARGRIMSQAGDPAEFQARAIVDDSAGYHDRHTTWRWSAGVGQDTNGRQLAWNLTENIHPRENTLWVDQTPQELPPPPFSPDLTNVGDLRFEAQAERAQTENRLLIRSRYRQPFGTFHGQVNGHTLANGYGVMEHHDVYW
ncbi:MAG: DUF2804 family protein [Solirubrobacterales bacterium]|nr:DUF2804 family protein [Solirubrobacterales bacterium]